jgi:hypothetical protein
MHLADFSVGYSRPLEDEARVGAERIAAYLRR